MSFKLLESQKLNQNHGFLFDALNPLQPNIRMHILQTVLY